jgi:hypothetical protein
MRYEDLHDHLEPPAPLAKHGRRDADPQTQNALAPGAPAAVQRAAMLDLQRAAGNASTSRLVEEDDPAAEVRGVLGSGGGQPLDRETRSFMESSLGTDFSGVRVHTGSAASNSARQLSAQAYTVGEDIVFGEGHYSPDSDSGKRVLAHELTHVVQQRSGPVSGTEMAGGLKVSDPSDSFERAAEHSADQVMAGAAVQRAALEEEEELQMSPVQRAELEEEEELQMSPVQRQTTEEESEEEELTEG